MPLAFINSLTRQNVVFYNLTYWRLVKLFTFLKEENRPLLGRRLFQKLLIQQGKNTYIATGYFKSYSLSLPPAKPPYLLGGGQLLPLLPESPKHLWDVS